MTAGGLFVFSCYAYYAAITRLLRAARNRISAFRPVFSGVRRGAGGMNYVLRVMSPKIFPAKAAQGRTMHGAGVARGRSRRRDMDIAKAGKRRKNAGRNRCRFDPMLCWGYREWAETHALRSHVRSGKIDREADIREVVARHVAAWEKAGYARREINEAAKKLRTALSERRCA